MCLKHVLCKFHVFYMPVACMEHVYFMNVMNALKCRTFTKLHERVLKVQVDDWTIDGHSFSHH